MAIVTAVPRVVPMWVFSRRTFPPLVMIWLKYIPVAVIAAMLAPQLLLHEGRIDLSAANPYFWVSLPTFVVAWKTKNIFLTVAIGIGCLAIVRF
ncbi:MAG: AzlD domain-containing protein [Deltaproteobacteria bacterium]|nr:AzlD domain-containing protein [Deltaproteobacteria bacterium]